MSPDVCSENASNSRKRETAGFLEATVRSLLSAQPIEQIDMKASYRGAGRHGPLCHEERLCPALHFQPT
jgi:hypothetical protein